MLKAIFNVRSAVRCLAVAALVFAAPAARAQEVAGDALIPLPSVMDFTRGNGFGLALGGSFEYSPAYEGANQYDRDWKGAGAVQWRRDNQMLFLEARENGKDFELGWRGLLGERLFAEAGFKRVNGREPRDSKYGLLDALDSFDKTYVGYAETRMALARDWENWIGARFQTKNNKYGTFGSLSYGHRIMGEGHDGTGIEAILFVTFADGDHLNRDFGVSADEAARSAMSGVADPLTETDIGGGYRSIGAKFVFRRYLNRHWHFIGEGGAEAYHGHISNSPVTLEDRDFVGRATLLYQF